MRLRQLAIAQRERIEFLEQLHKRAVEQIRKSRAECHEAQQRWHEEAERTLQLEQLIGSMQALPCNGKKQDREDDGLRLWEDYLSRSRLQTSTQVSSVGWTPGAQTRDDENSLLRS